MRLEPIDPEQILSREIKPSETSPIKYQNYRKNDSGLVIIDKNEDLTFSRNFLPLYTTTLNKKSFDTVVKAEFEEFVNVVSNTPVTFLQTQLEDIRAQRDSLLAARDLDRNKIAELTDTIQSLQQQIEDILKASATSTITSDTDFKAIFALDATTNTRFSLVCLLYQNQLYPIINGFERNSDGRPRGEIADACVQLLQDNGKKVTGVSGTLFASYLTNRIPDVAVYMENPAAGREAENLTSFNSVRYLGIDDVKRLVSGDLTPFTENG
jgi:hypothetical protein